MQGTTVWFNSKKGYGFLKPDGGGNDVFVHYSAILGEGYRQLADGDRVEFEVTNARGRQQADQVRKLEG